MNKQEVIDKIKPTSKRNFDYTDHFIQRIGERRVNHQGMPLSWSSLHMHMRKIDQHLDDHPELTPKTGYANLMFIHHQTNHKINIHLHPDGRTECVSYLNHEQPVDNFEHPEAHPNPKVRNRKPGKKIDLVDVIREMFEQKMCPPIVIYLD